MQTNELEKVSMDFSTMSDYLKCRRRGYYRHELNIVPKSPSSALAFGSAFHEAMTSWYLERDEKLAMEAFLESWNRSSAQWSEINSQDGIFGQDFGDDKRNAQNGLRILKEYFRTYQKEPFEIISNEFPFEILLGSDGERSYYLTGKIDLLVKWGEQILVVDHKTTSQLGPTFFRQFEPSLQIDGYVLAGKTIFGKCDGALINAVLVAKTKQTFDRDIFIKTEEDLETYRHEAMEHMYEIWRSRQRGGVPARNTDACTLYGSCPYRELCLAKGDERVIQTRYRTEVWNPFLA
jgi:CRISPR/Cas system-associated exonuclease Cas4 (RecB family)